MLQDLLYFLIALCASTVGAVCGIGGGVLVKPLLDLFGRESVSAISFLSGCMVLSMSAYSVLRGAVSRDNAVNAKTATPLAIGAALGGIAGKQLFSYVKLLFADGDTVGGVQSVCLAAITVGTLLYTVRKQSIKPRCVDNVVSYVFIGVCLGIMSSFLGIGGGPINIVVLHYFFSMDSKKAAANSLYVIAVSQLASLLVTLITRTVPEFSIFSLCLLVLGGILGGMVGRRFSKKMDNSAVDKLFICLMFAIVVICIYNSLKYLLF